MNKLQLQFLQRKEERDGQEKNDTKFVRVHILPTNTKPLHDSFMRVSDIEVIFLFFPVLGPIMVIFREPMRLYDTARLVLKSLFNFWPNYIPF